MLAKTNVPEFSASTEPDKPGHRPHQQPVEPGPHPGGSSGGESAAIAAGMSPIGIGSDVAISLRGPAALTGIAALKATHGRIPFTGHLAPMTSAWFHVGPMARTVRDIALGYSLLSGPDGIDGYAVHAKDNDSATSRIAGQTIRVGWVSDDAFGPVDPEITTAVADAAARLANLGCRVEQIDGRFLKHADALTAVMTFFYAQLVPYIKTLAAGREDDLFTTGAGIVAMEDPTTVPWAHVMDATSPFNLTGLPALSVPYGFSSENLPIGVQLVSNWFDESTILRLGALLERKGGLGNRRPPLAA